MRSKEVEEAIKKCNLLLMGDITLHIIDDDDGTAYAGTVDKQYNEDLKTVLSYIKTLEQLPNKIKDKIKLYELEIETLKTLYPKSYTKDDEYKLYVIKIQELKSIIGE